MDSGNVPENRLPEIRESETPNTIELSDITDSNLNNMSTGATKLGLGVHAPRIDISRASSSSQHDDSRDSSPENVFEQVS